MSTISDESITDLASHLNTLLQTKEKALQEKEADFARRVKLFESENPNTQLQRTVSLPLSLRKLTENSRSGTQDTVEFC